MNASTNTQELLTAKVNVGVWIPLVFIAILILLFNGTMCWAYIGHLRLRKNTTNLLICNQAATDSFNGLLVIPIHTAARYGQDGGLAPIVATYSILISICNLLSLAVDRYLLIIKPLYHRKAISLGRTRRIVLGIWIVPGIVSLIPFAWKNATPVFRRKSYEVFNCSILAVVIIMMLAMVLIYTRIFYFVKVYVKGKRTKLSNSSMTDRQKKKHVKMVKKELRITRLFFLLLLFFALAYTPIVYSNLVLLMNKANLAPQEVFETSVYFFVLNSVANPILCLMFKQDYQATVTKMLGFGRKPLRHYPLKSVFRSTESS